MATAYLLAGSNMGDKTSILDKANEMLQKISSAPIVVSHLYESEPWGFKTEEWFVNQAIRIETNLSPAELLKNVLEIEIIMGRVRNDNKTYCSRTLDIDILLYNNMIIDTAELIIPHPKLHLRKFAMVPLCDIAPFEVHPILNKSIIELIDDCEDTLIVRKIK